MGTTSFDKLSWLIIVLYIYDYIKVASIVEITVLSGKRQISRRRYSEGRLHLSTMQINDNV